MLKTKHFWNPYDKTNNLTLFSDKFSEHISIFDPCETLKVNGSNLGKPQKVAYLINVV